MVRVYCQLRRTWRHLETRHLGLLVGLIWSAELKLEDLSTLGITIPWLGTWTV